MGQDDGSTKGGAPKAVIHSQCPGCGHNNRHNGAPPKECEKCLYVFPSDEAARAAYDAMFGNPTFWYLLGRRLEGFFAGHSVRLVLLGSVFGMVLGKAARWLLWG